MTCEFAGCAKSRSRRGVGLMSRHSYPEAVNLTSPLAPETTCARERWPGVRRIHRSGHIAVAALLMATVLAACGGGNDQSQVEREVQDYLQSVVAPAEIADIDCPEDAPIRPGSTFLCDGLVERLAGVEVFVGNDCRSYASGGRALESLCIGLVAHDDTDRRVERPGSDRVQDRLEVRAASRDQDSDGTAQRDPS